jgi:organic hydroperoxide reductase OsmC/OhrA
MRASEACHSYTVSVQWTGNLGTGTSAYTDYERAHTIQVQGKPALLGSSDPNFRGDGSRYNPEELLIASLASCHMLWYLHLCAEANIIVTDYTDQAVGKMIDQGSKGGHFAEATLYPKVTMQPGVSSPLADEFHYRAHRLCFIASSVNFPVHIQATIIQT